MAIPLAALLAKPVRVSPIPTLPLAMSQTTMVSVDLNIIHMHRGE